ncbi:radical SAM family heme chaperone HemW [Calothrix sp. UHCC 0171]|uniref:radical SAM family heme chaperone HemW n=1 Tax=Calothrix sp. UHCC 0171 TaxID=3110245 RepID=UPI002B2146BC|nr:radical SAM family heme chaperone HemW [Calothrix sp. UHCC 0171]MEA5572188.1 radical SAM family heme chaperone HemW [Calothrix sp. UHCC 0171]
MINPPTSAYVHIPFCRRRCFYCDFPISVVGDSKRGETSSVIAHYVEVLCHEIAIATASSSGSPTPTHHPPLTTIFFGGGTPSLLSTEQLHRIISALEMGFGIAANAEISMEMDPGTFDFGHIQGYRHAGVTRVSFGVQAFQEELLQICGRSHHVADIYSAAQLIRQVNMPEFSLDLISGLPKQSLEMWQDSLKKAIALLPTHISIYDLTIEPGTAFGRYYKPGDQPLPSDEMTVDMYRMAQQILTSAGYTHYEISNYAKTGHQCRHNRVYWENRPYYGFGMGAASYIDGKRFSRPRKTKEYYAWVEAGAVVDCDATPADEELLDTLMLGLRLAEGVSLEKIKQGFGEEKEREILKILQPYFSEGWVEMRDQRLRLTDPEGFLFSNVVLAQLFTEL